MNYSLVCILVFVGTAAAFRGKFFDVKEKATEICDTDADCLANIEANAKPCMFAMKKGHKGHGGPGPRGRFGKDDRKGDGGPGGKRGPGSFKDKEDKKQVIINCLTENNVDETEVSELESLKRWEFKDGLKTFFATLKETDSDLAETIHCCIGQNMEPPVIGEDRELLLDNVQEKMKDKLDDSDEKDLLDVYLAATETCAEGFTACGFLEFKMCTIKECIKNYSPTTETELEA